MLKLEHANKMWAREKWKWKWKYWAMKMCRVHIFSGANFFSEELERVTKVQYIVSLCICSATATATSTQQIDHKKIGNHSKRRQCWYHFYGFPLCHRTDNNDNFSIAFVCYDCTFNFYLAHTLDRVSLLQVQCKMDLYADATFSDIVYLF